MKKNSGGFSIVELVLAIVVGGIFIAGITEITNNYISLSQKGRNIILSNSYAEDKMESLRNVGFSGLSNGSTDLSAELPSQLPTPKSATMTVSAPAANLKKIDLSVTYNDKGKNLTYSYTSYVGEISDLQ